MKILVYLEKSDVRGGIEIFAERHVARLRAEGHEVDVASDIRQEMGRYDEIVVHKCSDVSTLEKFPPEKTVYYVHDHEPICPRSYAYTPLKRNCTRPGGVWPCIFCAPLCRNWKPALNRVLSQERRKRAMARFRRLVVISEFMKGRLVANGIPAEKVEVRPPVIRTGETGAEDVTSGRKIDLLFVGQLIRGKGVQLLLAAMARMKTPRTLDIVGTGNMEPKLRALAAQLGIEGRVRFNGFQSNPQDWMRAAKCVVGRTGCARRSASSCRASGRSRTGSSRQRRSRSDVPSSRSLSADSPRRAAERRRSSRQATSTRSRMHWSCLDAQS